VQTIIIIIVIIIPGNRRKSHAPHISWGGNASAFDEADEIAIHVTEPEVAASLSCHHPHVVVVV
jgi:hypothetical protein